MKRDLVVGMGELLFDVFPDGERIGGAPVNFAYHVRQAGLDVLAVSAVGRDAAGDRIIDILERHSLPYDVARVDKPTGKVSVTLDAAGVPNFVIHEDSAWDCIPFTPALEAAARRCRAFCFGTLAQRCPVSRTSIHAFLDAMGDSDDVLKIYDANLRQHYYSREIVEASLCKCNVLKINDDEFRIFGEMFGFATDGFDDGCRMLCETYGLRAVILTCGADGSRIYAADGDSFLPTPRVEVVDTVGAGDSFTGAFVAAILSGRTIAEAHAAAVQTAAYVCTCAGAWTPPCE